MNADNNRSVALTALQRYRDELRRKAEGLNRDLEAVNRSIELLGGKATEGPVGDLPNTSGYAGLLPQAAVEKLLRDNPNTAFKPSAAAKELIRLGCVPRKESYYATQITSAMKRAVQKGIATAERVEGRTAFRLRLKEADRACKS